MNVQKKHQAWEPWQWEDKEREARACDALLSGLGNVMALALQAATKGADSKECSVLKVGCVGMVGCGRMRWPIQP